MLLYDEPDSTSPIFLLQNIGLEGQQGHPILFSITPPYLYQFSPYIFIYSLYLLSALMSMMTLISILRVFLLVLYVWTTQIILVLIPYTYISYGVHIVPVFHNTWQKFLDVPKICLSLLQNLLKNSILPHCPT